MKWSVWLIFFLFIVLRFIFALQLPIFNDESIYLRWGFGFLQAPDRWWAFMHDGKQPGVAITFGIAQLLPMDPLVAMRLLSIAWSSITFWVVYAIWKRVSPQSKSFIIVGLLLVFCPYLILFDSLAIAESAITACFTLLFLLSISLGQKPSIWKAAGIGVVFAAGWWFKSTILLGLPLVIVTLCLYWKTWKGQWPRIIFGLFLGALVALAMVSPVLFNPNIDYKNTEVIQRTLTLKQVLAFPFMRWLGAWIAAASWFIAYGGPLIVLFSMIAVWKHRKSQTTYVLLLWTLIPVVIETILLTSLSGRLLTIGVIPLLLLAARGISDMRHRVVQYFSVVSVVFAGIVLCVWPLYFFQLLKPLPAAQGDFSQYVTSWQSGYGVKEAIDFLKGESKKHRMIVFVRLDSGNPEDAVIAHMEKAHIPVFYIQQINEIAKIKELALLPWYFVSRGPQYEGMEKYLTEVAKFKKPMDEEFVGVYTINP